MQPVAVEPTRPVDLNWSSAAELESLPGIGPALAARIVAARPFSAVDDLGRVRGIGSATTARLRPLVTIEATEPSPPPPVGTEDR